MAFQERFFLLFKHVEGKIRLNLSDFELDEDVNEQYDGNFVTQMAFYVGRIAFYVIFEAIYHTFMSNLRLFRPFGLDSGP